MIPQAPPLAARTTWPPSTVADGRALVLFVWLHSFFLNLFIYFIYFWLCWVFVSVRGLSLVAASRGRSSLRCAGLSLSRPLFVAEHRLQTRRLSSCGSGAQLLRGMWDLPRPGLGPVSPALAGRFSTTAPPGKPVWLHSYLGTPLPESWRPSWPLCSPVPIIRSFHVDFFRSPYSHHLPGNKVSVMEGAHSKPLPLRLNLHP